MKVVGEGDVRMTYDGARLKTAGPAKVTRSGNTITVKRTGGISINTGSFSVGHIGNVSGSGMSISGRNNVINGVSINGSARVDFSDGEMLINGRPLSAYTQGSSASSEPAGQPIDIPMAGIENISLNGTSHFLWQQPTTTIGRLKVQCSGASTFVSCIEMINDLTLYLSGTSKAFGQTEQFVRTLHANLSGMAEMMDFHARSHSISISGMATAHLCSHSTEKIRCSGMSRGDLRPCRNRSCKFASMSAIVEEPLEPRLTLQQEVLSLVSKPENPVTKTNNPASKPKNPVTKPAAKPKKKRLTIPVPDDN